MAREAYVREDAPCETVKYTNSSAVSAGEVIFVAGIGAMIASTDYDASAEGVYYVKGIFQFHIADSATITQGTKCYWDYGSNHLIASSSTSLSISGGDFYLGRAVADGSATAGYVDVEINNNRIDFSGLGRTVPAAVIVEHGLQTCVNVTLATNATLETILLTQVLTTDTAFVQYADAPDGDATSRVIWAKCNSGSVTVGLSTPANASASSTRLSYRVCRAI